MATETQVKPVVTGAAGFIGSGLVTILPRRAIACRPRQSFDTVVVPHLDAAHRLARRLMRDAHDAEDVVQEASLRALRYFQTFAGGDGRAWFLRIVRNTCYGWRRNGFPPATDPFDEEQHSSTRTQSNAEMLLVQADDARSMTRALGSLPDHFHQLLVLREFEGLSYQELSEAIGIPMGTVMSRLSRARQALRKALTPGSGRPAFSSRLQAREQEAVLVRHERNTRVPSRVLLRGTGLSRIKEKT